MQSVICNSVLRILMCSIVLFALCYQKTLALTCYDNTGKDGEMRLTSNDEWTFCSLIPESAVNENAGGKVYGLGPSNDDLEPYVLGFSNNDEKYQVLSMCIFERYDFRSFSQKFQAPELLFRCVCNYDKCNTLSTFDHYLVRLAEKPRL